MIQYYTFISIVFIGPLKLQYILRFITKLLFPFFLPKTHGFLGPTRSDSAQLVSPGRLKIVVLRGRSCPGWPPWFLVEGLVLRLLGGFSGLFFSCTLVSCTGASVPTRSHLREKCPRLHDTQCLVHLLVLDQAEDSSESDRQVLSTPSTFCPGLFLLLRYPQVA